MMGRSERKVAVPCRIGECKIGESRMVECRVWRMQVGECKTSEDWRNVANTWAGFLRRGA
jgi:hypothetical protein